MKAALNQWRSHYVKGLVIEIPMSSGLAPIFAVLGSILRGTGYVLLAPSSKKTNVGENSLFSTASALRDRWLYKYATSIVVNTPDVRARIERESAGLDVPVLLMSCENN